jgi:hypothetical protein
MDNMNPNQPQINIELSEEVAEGTYANLAIITHSQAEFIVDFVNMMPGVPKARVKSRIIMTPQHTKRLFRALKENIMKFEAMHGEIVVSDDMGMMPFPMTGPKGQA